MSVLKFPTPLESAVDSAFRKTFNSKLTPEGKATFMEELKRELEKAVPALGWDSCHDDYTKGHNECRKLVGLE